jgi:predicted ATPase
LIPETQRAAAHLRIGRLLAAHTSADKREDAIFEIVNQLNRGVELIVSGEEKEQLAELNLIAGKRAKASTAYLSALNYLVFGTALLSDDGWKRRPDLMFALELQRAECEFLTAQLAAAEARLLMLSSRAANTVDQRWSRACALTFTRRSTRATGRLMCVSPTCVTWASNGRLTRQKRRHDENTLGCGRCSDTVKSRSSWIFP